MMIGGGLLGAGGFLGTAAVVEFCDVGSFLDLLLLDGPGSPLSSSESPLK